MKKKFSIYTILVPLFAILSCWITSLWFIAYDNDHDIFLLMFGLATFVNYIISLIAKHGYWLVVDKKTGDNEERLLLFLIPSVFGLVPLLNCIIFIVFLCLIVYHGIKFFIEKSDIEIEI